MTDSNLTKSRANMTEFKEKENKVMEISRIELSKETRKKAQELLQNKFRIQSIYGVNVYLDEKTKKFVFDESPNKICILVYPKTKDIGNPIYHDVDLRNYKEFNGTGISSASAAKLAWMVVKGYVFPDFDLEHLDDHHNCINPMHQHPVPRSLNQKRKVCKLDPHELKKRNDKGRFQKAKNRRTHVPATCDHGPDIPNCIYNLIQSTSKDWQNPEKNLIYKKLVRDSLQEIEMSPLWC